jgi:RNA polymerase sigma factor (TIGR02999 family)
MFGAVVVEPPVSDLMEAAERGEAGAADALFGALDAELHRVARRQLARHGWGVSIGATSLLHDAYLALAGRSGDAFPDERRFLAYAARVMRGLIIDYARRQQALKRGGQFHLTAISTGVAESVGAGPDLGVLAGALDELGALDPQLAHLVDLKFFCGFSVPEIAAMQGMSERTVERSWQKARLFLHRAVRQDLLQE